MAEAAGPGLSLALAPTLAAIGEAQERLRAWLAEAGAPADLVFRAELVAEEMLANIVRHAGLPAAARIGFTAERPQAGGVRLCTEDSGPAFDPRRAPPRPRPRGLAEAEPGGLGLALIHRMAAALDYERTAAGANRFGVTVRADDPAGSAGAQAGGTRQGQ